MDRVYKKQFVKKPKSNTEDKGFGIIVGIMVSADYDYFFR
jgi:hypothetical protein